MRTQIAYVYRMVLSARSWKPGLLEEVAEWQRLLDQDNLWDDGGAGTDSLNEIISLVEALPDQTPAPQMVFAIHHKLILEWIIQGLLVEILYRQGQPVEVFLHDMPAGETKGVLLQDHRDATLQMIERMIRP